MKQNWRISSLAFLAAVILIGVWISHGSTPANRAVVAADMEQPITGMENVSHPTGVHIPVVYLAGDSTVQTYATAQRPQAGWGQMIARYFDQGIQFSNHAMSGRSTRSFIEQGRLDAITSQLQPGDYLMIQFGHNDANSARADRYTPVPDYARYLKEYIDLAYEKDATPILVTPVSRREYDVTAKQFKRSFPEYVQAMKQVAVETNTLLIDLNASSAELYTTLGVEATQSTFLHTMPGQSPAFPNGIQDDTHFQEQGARQIAGLVASGIKQLDIPLAQHVLASK